MFQTPSAWDEVRLWVCVFLTSFSVESGALSSKDKPATAESTLVSGTDMVDGWDGEDGGGKLGVEEEEGASRWPERGKSWMSCLDTLFTPLLALLLSAFISSTCITAWSDLPFLGISMARLWFPFQSRSLAHPRHRRITRATDIRGDVWLRRQPIYVLHPAFGSTRLYFGSTRNWWLGKIGIYTGAEIAELTPDMSAIIQYFVSHGGNGVDRLMSCRHRSAHAECLDSPEHATTGWVGLSLFCCYFQS